MRFFVQILPVFLASNGGGVNLERLKSSLDMAFDAASEARDFLAKDKYDEAAQSFGDALNLGRKPVLTMQELENDIVDEEDQKEALDWLIDICCESSILNLNHLEKIDQARSDAWAACMFSQYGKWKPLNCMRLVCVRQNDSIGELQACKQLLDLPKEESPDKSEREAVSKRLNQLEEMLGAGSTK